MRKIRPIPIKELHFLKPAIEKHPHNHIPLEFLIKQDAIAALLLNEDATKAFLVKQYRPGAGKELYEIPAGLIEEKEDPKLACFREIEEETGYLPKDYKILYTPDKALFVSPGYTEEALYFYIFQLYSDNTIPQALKLDEGEELVGSWIPIEEIFSENKPHISCDLKTIFCFLLWKSL
ncbi:NUDIX hydrolase [Fusobacterium gonidiaformans]|uniref:NUDIX hydrolase n=1 Tax=Fusobacterium gonidiaformans TaxID=849 RepID=UPI0001BC6576|nr:NUDIX hydrolase [Fusobacterium gonidiaformans]AVQ16261.1 NUDIX hydrolase [Fusobacterium gonidiaformans ATCC 25563]EFS28518.1 hypothetical protein FGAG_00839 [Fusobacterium gonidiaformans ATCC 25563]